jgi:hypothetical protein
MRKCRRLCPAVLVFVQSGQPQADMVTLFRDEEAATAATEAATPLFEPDFEVVLVRSDIDRATYRGLRGAAERLDRLARAVGELSFRGRGTRGPRRLGRGPRSRLRPPQGHGARGRRQRRRCHAFRGDKISHIEFHFDREEGIAAVGIRDRDD